MKEVTKEGVVDGGVVEEIPSEIQTKETPGILAQIEEMIFGTAEPVAAEPVAVEPATIVAAEETKTEVSTIMEKVTSWFSGDK